MTVRDQGMCWWLRRIGALTTLDKFRERTPAERRRLLSGFSVVDAYAAGYEAGTRKAKRDGRRK